ncbi:HNH endonuclease signature motif containing protein [Terrabacter sp. AAH1]
MPYVASSRTPAESTWLGRFHAEVEYAAPDADRSCRPRVEDERSRSVAVTETLLRAGERVMAQIEALEAVKARVEADLIAAYGALHTIQEQQIAALPAGSSRRAAALVSPERVVAEDIALATGVGAGEVGRRLTLATSPRRHRRLLEALRAGATSLYRAVQVASETVQLSDADVATVEEAVLAPSRDGQVVGQRTFTARLRRAVASVDNRGAEERHAQARARRGVFGRMVEDGMGSLTVTADAGTIAAIMDRLDTTARGLRGSGDPRTLDQRRCDLATAALLSGHLDPAKVTDEMTGDAAARVWLVVPFEVATGHSDAACELPGHGWVTAAHARELMTRPGSVWQTLPVDLRDGQAINRPTKAYRPTTAMVEHVRAVDGTCRGPDCTTPATRCDLDHEIPWPAGETSVSNFYAKERRHHNLKTHQVWTSTPTPDGGLQWTTLTGRTHTTYPKDWREGIGPPGDDPPPF